MRQRLNALLRKEGRQLVRSRRTVAAAAVVPLLMLVFVTSGDIVVMRLGFGSHPLYLLSASRSIAAPTLLRHYTLPVLVSLSALVTPSIVMGNLLFGERESRTLELLVSLPISAVDVVLAKLGAVLAFALGVTVPLFLLNALIVSLTGYGSWVEEIALAEILLASVAYSATTALFIAVASGDARAASIMSGLILGPVVPLEGVILASIPGAAGISVCAIGLLVAGIAALAWSMSRLSFERLFGTA